jgi:hypothetical protein
MGIRCATNSIAKADSGVDAAVEVAKLAESLQYAHDVDVIYR